MSSDHSKLREQVQLWVQCACCLLSQTWKLSSTASNILQVIQAAGGWALMRLLPCHQGGFWIQRGA